MVAVGVFGEWVHIELSIGMTRDDKDCQERGVNGKEEEELKNRGRYGSPLIPLLVQDAMSYLKTRLKRLSLVHLQV